MKRSSTTFESERFPRADLIELREELLTSNRDLWQTSEFIAIFLVQHGYGVSHANIQRTAARLPALCGSLQGMQDELASLALPM